MSDLTEVTGVPAQVVDKSGKPSDEDDGLLNTSVAPYRRFVEYLDAIKLEQKEVRSNRFAIRFKGVEIYAGIPNKQLADLFQGDIEKMINSHSMRVRKLVKSVEDALSGTIELMELQGITEEPAFHGE